MENLSSEELSMLLAIKRRPNMRLAMYGNSLKIAYIKALHTRNDLLHKNLILENGEGLMQVNEKAIKEHNIKLILANGEQPDPEPEVVAVETETVTKLQKFEDVENKVVEMLKASPHGRTAKELAAPFGTKGTSLNWTLRNLATKNLIVKRDTKYFIAEECDKVVSIPVPPVDTRREVNTDFELRTFILNTEGEHTLEEACSDLARLYKFDREKFCEIFTDLVLDGYYNVHDGDGYVQHDLDFSPSNKHERCVNVSSEQGVGELIDDFLNGRSGSKFTLRSIVKSTSVRHDLITKQLDANGWDVSDPVLIQRKKLSRFTKFEDIDVNVARQLIFGIVKLDVFIKRFNLDPATKDEVVKLLELVKMAKYDAASGFLGPVKPEPEKEEPVEAEIEDVRGEVRAEGNAAILENLETAIVNAVGPDIVQSEEDADDVADEDAGIVDYDSSPEEIEHASTGKFVSHNDVQVSAPAVEIPTHINVRSSPLYGHKILGMSEQEGAEPGSLKVASEPDLAWIAAQPDATDVEKAMTMLTRENMIAFLQQRYPVRHVTVDEIDPSQPVEIEMTMDWESLKSPDSFEREPVPEPATIMDMVRDGFRMLDKAQVLELLAELQDKVSDTKAEPEKKIKSFAELWELENKTDEPKRKCWCNKPEHDLRKGPCGPSGPDDSGLVAHVVKKPVPESEVKSVNPQWIMTLQMLAERFQHEHQYTSAQILRDIHDYLAPK